MNYIDCILLSNVCQCNDTSKLDLLDYIIWIPHDTLLCDIIYFVSITNKSVVPGAYSEFLEVNLFIIFIGKLCISRISYAINL